MKASPLQNNFIGGEFSPLTRARVDSDLYNTGLERCLNYIPLVQGPLTRRPGTYYVATGKNAGAFRQIRLQAFEFSTIQAYILAFGDGYIRFFRNNGPVESAPGVPYEIASPYLAEHVMELQFTQSADLLYITHPLYAPRTLSRVSHTNWTLAQIDFQDGPYLTQNVGAVTLTPSATTGTITVTASAATFASTDVGRLIRIKEAGSWGWVKITAFTSSTVVTAEVKGTLGGTAAVTIWRLGLWSETTGYPTTTTFHEDRLFFAGNKSNPQRVDGSVTGDYTNFAPTGTDGTLLASNALGFTLNSNDVNAIQWLSSDEKGLLVGTVGGEWVVKAASSLESLNATNIVAKRGSSYGSTTIQPVQVGKSAIFVQRSGKKVRDMRYYYDVDGFRAADLTLLSEHITGTGLVQLAFQKEPQQIVWAARADGALIGMSYEREFETVKIGWHRHFLGGQGDKAGNPSKVKSLAAIPSPDGQRNELWLAVERWNGTTWVIHIEYMTAIFESDDVTTAFFVDNGLTYDVPLEIAAVTLGAQTLIGSLAHGLSNGDRVKISDIPGTTELNGKVFLVSDATANDFKIKDLSGNYIDSTDYTAFAYDGTNPGYARKMVLTVSGLAHLEGKTVAVLADGQPVSGKTVTGGAIALTEHAATIHVGYNYVSEGQQLRQEAGSTEGTALGKTRRTHRVGFYLYRSTGLQFGVNFEKLEKLIFRKTSDAYGVATPLFTGIISENIPASYDFENQICWRQDQPLPSTILAIMPQMMTQDRG